MRIFMTENTILTFMTAAKVRLIALAAVTVALFAVMSVIADFPLLDTMWAAGAEDIHQIGRASCRERV
jgi:steroid 5-alpha reductase family enzyme